MCFKDNKLFPHLTSCLLKRINSKTCLYITGRGWRVVETTEGTRNGTFIRYHTITSDLQPFNTHRFIYNTDCCSTKSEELDFSWCSPGGPYVQILCLLSQEFVRGAGFQVHAMCMQRGAY